jgi:hypothetical protein
MYQQVKPTVDCQTAQYIKRLLDNLDILFQAYLVWLAAGNTPEPADQ